ncbi:glycosyltransferase [Mangrovimonas sp. DI 80]|uniref:glycosyltransferase family 2 protein n=1 Tax=Mangrovimonas sp. DI 80 TaxID=1779330 RepID=UPI000976989E|nr:glycosyltransferase [Mangrovimonas sp. DI 80]OMP31159.1 hypothetical protein BKM32_08845 [Mangrovimonas sp. DI 80]
MSLPLVSICIPTYNGARFIKQAMDSAIAQTYSNLEIVVSDDDSRDNTLEIIESYKNKTNIPIYIMGHQPNGIGSNWNNCIKHAKGVYIKFLFQDDVLMPECVSQMVLVIEKEKRVDIVACKREFIIDSSFENIQSKKWIDHMADLQKTLNLEYNENIAYLDKTLFCSDQFFETPLNKVGEPSTILFKKELVNRIGYFSEELNQVLDYEFCYRVLKTRRIAIMQKTLVKFRLHGLQATVKNKDNEIFGADFKKLERIYVSNYIRLLDPYMRKVLLRRNNRWVSSFYNTIDNIKSWL